MKLWKSFQSQNEKRALASKMSVHSFWCHSNILTDIETHQSNCKRASVDHIGTERCFNKKRFELKKGWLENAPPANWKQRKIEAKLNFIKHSDFSWDHGSQRHLKPWSETWLAFFKNNTPAVKQNLFEKIILRQVTITGSHTRKIEILVTFFPVRPFRCPMHKRFAQ